MQRAPATQIKNRPASLGFSDLSVPVHTVVAERHVSSLVVDLFVVIYDALSELMQKKEPHDCEAALLHQ